MSAPIVTIDQTDVEVALACIAAGIMILSLSALVLWRGPLRSESNCDDGLSLGEMSVGIAGLVGLVIAITGGIGFISYATGGMDKLQHPALLSAVEDTYGVENVKPIDDGGKFTLGDDSRVPDKDDVCQPVTTESPEYTGVVDGQQISFKVGVEGCRSNTPDVQIIITATPGTPLTPDQLRKQAVTH